MSNMCPVGYVMYISHQMTQDKEKIIKNQPLLCDDPV